MNLLMQSALQRHILAIETLSSDGFSTIEKMSLALSECFREGRKLLICGCGGSAADAQHIAGEFVNRLRYDRGALSAIALTVDTSVLTCIANDTSFECVFERQVEALGRLGDVLLALSTSGRSTVVLRALKAARAHGLVTFGFTGMEGVESMAPLCDELLVAPTSDTACIQECHEFAYHLVCTLVEREIFPDIEISDMEINDRNLHAVGKRI